MRLLLRALPIALLVGCTSSFAPDSAPLTPPSAYLQWWQATKACSGLTGDFSRLRFSVIEGRDFECPSGRCVGRWEPASTIILASSYAHSELVVRHEMLHALIGHSGHPDIPFRQRCGLTWDTWNTGGANPTGLPAFDHPD